MQLVVYFSYTGHTKLIAEKIKDRLNCDILELKRVEPYSSDYNEVVNDEQNGENSNIISEIEDINIDLSKYDEIILGTPVWWYRPAPVVRAFLKKYDLSGKTIIPFATNAGWLGRTFAEIKSLCLSSTVTDEMDIVFTTDYAENKTVTKTSEIDAWIDNLRKD